MEAVDAAAAVPQWAAAADEAKELITPQGMQPCGVFCGRKMSLIRYTKKHPHDGMGAFHHFTL